MVKIDSKPSRKKLLEVISELQHLIGQASGTHGNDRNPDGFEQGQRLLHEAFELCLRATRFDPPQDAWAPRRERRNHD